MADSKGVRGIDCDFDHEEHTSSSSSSSSSSSDHDEKEIIYVTGNNLSKQIRDAGCGSNPPAGTLVDPQGFNINPVAGTPDGVSVIVVDKHGHGKLVPQPQPEGILQVAPCRDPGGALVYDAEPHHVLVSDDKKRLLVIGAFNNFVYVYDVRGDNKRHPKLIHSVDLAPSGFVGPHDVIELDDGSFLVSMLGQTSSVPQGLGPGGLIRITRDGTIIDDVTAVNHTLFNSGLHSIAINDDKLLAASEFVTNFYANSQLDLAPPIDVGHAVMLFKFNPKHPEMITSAFQTVVLTDGAGNDGFYGIQPTFWPGELKSQEVIFATALSSGVWALYRDAGSNGPFTPQLIYQLPFGIPPVHGAVHGFVFTKGTKNEVKYDKLYVTDAWGDALHVLDMSNGLPPLGQYFSTTPGDPFSVETISNRNVTWVAFTKNGRHLYTSNLLYSLYDWILCKYPPVTTYELRRYAVDHHGKVSSSPDLIVPAPTGYGFGNFDLRIGAEHPGFIG